MIFKNARNIIENGLTPEIKKIRADILKIFNSSIEAVNPYNAVIKHIDKNKLVYDTQVFDLENFEKIYVVSFGKASIGMTQAFCDKLNVTKGIVITNQKDKKVNSDKIETIIGSHPIPNEKSIEGADKIIKLIENCTEKDLLIVLISGGGSALLAKPKINLFDLQKTTDLLLKSGANINEINTIRKHLSYVKGGQLIKNVKCQVISMIISDIIGDPLEFISSGPTYPDSTSYEDSLRIIKKYNLIDNVPTSTINTIKKGISGNIPETLKSDDPIFKNVSNFIIANNKLACIKAKEKAGELGYKTIYLTSAIDGEARDIGRFLVEKAKNYETNNKKTLFISGGETTVTIKGKGKGGRNQEMVLAVVENISDENIIFSSFASDGVDGMSDAAGAIADKYSLKRCKEKNILPDGYLNNNDSYNFFKKIGDLLITNSTGTNVMDIQIIVKFS